MDAIKTVAFAGTVAARSSQVLVSKRIGTGFGLRRIHATFPPGCINLVYLRFYISPDDDAPASGHPTGVSVLRDYGQVDYVIGDDQKKELEHHVEQPEGGYYMKVYAVNDDYYAHAVDVQMFIELLERE